MSAPASPLLGLMNFAVLPPEVNSGLMYTGAGAAPLMAAGTAWSDLAAELSAAAHACGMVLAELVNLDWRGPAANAMAAAAAPYTTWMSQTATQVAHAAAQAFAAAGAFETAFAAVVPPVVVAENRARTALLIATNILGQNSAAIAASELAYAEMWAQDVGAMFNYAGSAAAATQLSPLATPPSTTTANAQSSPAAASGQAAASASSDSGNSVAQMLSGLANSMNIFAPNSGNDTGGLSGLLNMFSGANPTTASPFSNFMNSTLMNSALAGAPYSPAFIGQVIGDMTALETVLGRTLAAPAAALSSSTSSLGAAASAGSSGMGTLAAASSPAGLSAAPAVSAEVGKATLVRSLSVPAGWTGAAAPLEAAAAAPMSTASAAAPVSSPVITAGMPAAAPSMASRMVDKAEDEEPEDGPVYGHPTRALVRTPAGG